MEPTTKGSAATQNEMREVAISHIKIRDHLFSEECHLCMIATWVMPASPSSDVTQKVLLAVLEYERAKRAIGPFDPASDGAARFFAAETLMREAVVEWAALTETLL